MATHDSRSQRWAVGVAALLLACAAAFLAVPANTATAQTGGVKVNFVVLTEGGDGYDDISTGSTVEVVDGSGRLLGFGTLRWDAAYTDRALDSEDYNPCIWRYIANFNIKKSPDGFYRITAGNANRGYVSYSERDVKRGKLRARAMLCF